ncbi:fibrillin-1-like [Sitodiplosis mosellana]|uniref:fibrillin-1-like n=1 Tax=Sitodiplosis mosellana TaxID=263140 RepID=UPI0024449F07|nr:fibrillin-1-like [Sitodiplosis mosellana]
MFFKFTVLLVCVYIGCGSAYPNDNANTEKSSIATRHRRSPNLGNSSQCGGFPLKNRVRSSCPTPTTCYTECEQGFQFPNNKSKVELICDVGEWQLKGLGTFNTINCEPVCHCQNGGTCTAPNFCACPKNYGGEQCELLTCDTVPNILNSYPNCTLTNCNITCNDRYSFADGSTVVQINCEKGKFNLAPNQSHQTIPSACQPICKTPCQHNGVCSQPEKCSCPSHYEGDHCELEKVPVVKCPDKPVFKNGRINCNSTNECKVNCFNGFELPDGTIVMAITCQQGQWKAKYSKQNFDPFCTRKCSPPCQNGGECLKNNTCICPKDYEGDHCEFKKGCKTNPITQNANSECNVDNCKITCDKGHVLPDHSTEMHMKCEKLADVSDGITEFGWMPVNSKQNFDPICEPVCSQPCQNGGVCTKPNTCSCPNGFDGPQCGRKVCVPQPALQDAHSSCDQFNCKITCNQGYVFPDGSDVMQMDCKNGKWESASLKQISAPDCQLKCNAGFVYNKCGPNVEQTCDNAEEKSVCVPGCFCPNGMVKHEGKCIQPDNCPCRSNGAIFQPESETVSTDDALSVATTCKCERATMRCKSEPFTRMRCSVTGDPHIRSFDDITYDIQRKGSFRLVNTSNTVIEAQFVPCGGPYSCTKSITIKVNHGNRNATVVLKQNLKVEVNGQPVEIFPMQVLSDYMLISLPSSTKVLVVSKEGWRIFWDGRINVDIDTISLYKGKINGLCEVNKNKRRKRSTEVDMKAWLATIAQKSCIGDSYNSIDEFVNIPNPCDANVEAMERAERLCSKLKDDPFKACHGTVNPQTHYDNCMFDMCACERGIDSCMCDIFTVYANECSRRGNVVKYWRQSIQECAIKCPTGQIYEECSKSCYHSCDDLQLSPKNCTRDCVYGCRCPEGQALDRNNKCISIDMCHSFDQEPRHDQIGANQTCAWTELGWKCVYEPNSTNSNTAQTQESCMPVSLNATQTVGIVQLTGSKYGKCVNTEPIQGYTECRGTCGPVNSNTGLANRQFHEEKCCSMIKYEKLRVPMLCESGKKFISSVYIPRECSCSNCNQRYPSFSAKQNAQVAQCGGLPLKQFAWSSCPDSSSCYTKCNSNYQFPNGLSKVELICDAGIWFLKGLGNIAHFECEPICVPSCKNNGRCVAPDICICPKNFSGSSCNQLHCNTVPDVLHSNRSCTSTNCTITCHQGYKFADNSMSMELKCENGQFTPIHKNQTIPLACQPHCLSSCKNGEICTAPNKCTCPSGYDHCELRKVPVVNCATKPVIKNGRLNCSFIDECKVDCFKGFELPDGTIAMVVTCQQGQWKAKYSKQNFDPFCTRKCSPPCQNGGECLKNNTCICPKDYEGDHCEFKKGCRTNPITQNANSKCNVDNCKITCDKGHVLPDHSTEMHMKCEKLVDVSDGITEFGWMPVNSKQNFVPICNPVCSQPCHNGGVCTKPNTCTCPPRFEGKLCQDEMGCKTSPTTKNANAKCTLDDCKVTCDSGYALPDKSTEMELKCKHQKWELTKPKQSFDPICNPVCSQPCQNGGVCTKPNTCMCPPRFEGKLCQDAKGCKTSPTTQNANAKCTFDDCKVTCASGYALPDNSTEMDLICDQGHWKSMNLKQNFFPICKPVCDPPCQNGGKCNYPNYCSCPSGFKGHQCQNKWCKGFPSVKNARYGCHNYECIMFCVEGYKYPDKSVKIDMICKNEKWIPKSPRQNFSPLECRPICDRPCPNGQECSKPNTCTCPMKCEGDFCELGCDSKCGYVPNILNSDSSCNPTNCTIICHDGYRFSDGTYKLELKCESDLFESIHTNQTIPSCQPVCRYSCRNDGVCIKPDTCSCPPRFEGNLCQHKKGCETPPRTQNANVKCDIEDCKVTCEKGYALADNSTEMDLICEERQWKPTNSKQNFDPICKPVCGPACQNEFLQVCTEPPSSNNSKLECSDMETCTLTCERGYEFQDGSTEMKMICDERTWIPPKLEEKISPNCYPACKPKCNNNGTCIKPNTCSCPENFDGYFCEIEKDHQIKPILKDPTLKNPTLNCDTMPCEIACASGFAFPNGNTSMKITYEQLNWKSISDGFSLKCQPVCTPPCETGQCTWPNTCVCAKNKEGDRCEFPKGCRTNPLTQNALAICNSDKCTITCDTGYALPDGTKAMELTCIQHVWQPVKSTQEFSPICTPVCELPCLNGGKCAGPNTCSCLAGFGGHQCERKICMESPSSQNAVSSCTADHCRITCNAGYDFLDGSEIMEINCTNGGWVPDFRNQNFNPDCKAKCNKNIGTVFNNCGPRTERTCASTHEDRSECIAGCFCPKEMVKHDGICIPLNECPCFYDGELWPAGSEPIFPNYQVALCEGIPSLCRDSSSILLNISSCSIFSEIKMFLKFIVLIFGIHASCSTANQNVHIDKCGGLPLKQFARSSCPDSKTCYTECDSNYQFSNGQSKVELFCNAGIWSLKGLGDIAQFECDPTCASCINGKCVAPNICVCDKNFAGPRCDEDKCNTVPNILNSDQSCTPTNCQITCKPGYKFADGSTLMNLKCKNGGFVSIQKSQAVSSDCQPVCNQPCQNGGVCDQPDKCSCPKDYEGNYCEHERGCKTKPAIQNAKTSNCNSDTCNAYCEAGYAFPDSSTDMELICVQRVWQSKSNQNLPLNCTPHCFSPCINGGNCTGPNKCTCPSGYEGDHCESEKDCQTKPASQNTTLNCDTKQCDITCASGHAFPDGTTSMKMTCEQHIWKPVTPSQSFQPYCQPVCTPSCLNGGQCIEPNKCLCPRKYEGNQCEYKKGCPTKPDLQNAVASDCNLDKCTVTCDTGFALPDGTTKMELTCIQRNWYSAAQPTQNADTLTCKPICSSPCLNGGQCTNPNTCSCPAGFDGPQCGNKICKTNPTAQNAVASCTADHCKINCNTGYNFPDGATVRDMNCIYSHWITVTFDQNSDCQPVCNLPCLNGGQCTKPNTCSCPAGFDGPQCGNKMCTTNPSAQNGVRNCTADHCKITCNAGFNFPDSSSVMDMSCKNGDWVSNSPNQNFNPDCQLECNAGFVFNNCGPRTERTCASAYEDRSVCVPGCFCPNGMIKHNGNCIQSNQCPCSRNGVEYMAGSSSTFANDFSTNAEVCQCNNGQMACTSQSFTRKRCTAWGDPHFTTIYGNSYNFMGRETYSYLKTDNIEIDAYLVGWPNSWDAATVTDSVTIKAKFNNKEATIKLMKDLYVQVNGASNYYYPLILLDGFAVINKPSSNQISVSFQNGFIVFWNGAWQVDIDVPSIYYGGMSGLCTSEYSRRRRSTNAGDIKAWLTSIAKKSCIGESCKTIEQAVNVPHPCDSNMETKKRAEGLCARLKSDTFRSCHGTVDPESYYENCLFDACASNHDIDSCMCGAFTAYANECSRRGNVIEQWRESIQECAIKCPKGQIYQECSKSCYHSCVDLILYPKNCTRDCVSGCRCPQGKVLDEKDECILIDMCPLDQNLPTFKCQPRPDPIGTNQTCTCIGTEWECVNSVDDHTPTPQGIDSRPCEPVSLNATQTVGIVQITGAVYGTCVNTGPIRGYKECRGTCELVTSYTGLTRRISHEEKCCSMSKYETVQVPLLCESGIKLISSVHVAKECSCQNCD